MRSRKSRATSSFLRGLFRMHFTLGNTISTSWMHSLGDLPCLMVHILKECPRFACEVAFLLAFACPAIGIVWCLHLKNAAPSI